MTLTTPLKVVRFSSPSTLDTGLPVGTATMGRTREKNADRVKVSLYIVKRRFQESRKSSGDCLQENEQWDVGEDDGGRSMKKK